MLGGAGRGFAAMASIASLGLTLRLLPAPTAAVVAAGLGLDLISKHYNPALAFSYGQPYDDDVFQVWERGEARGNCRTGNEAALPLHWSSYAMCDLSPCIAQKEARLGTEGLGGDSPALEQVEGLPLSLLSLKTVCLFWVQWFCCEPRRGLGGGRCSPMACEHAAQHCPTLSVLHRLLPFAPRQRPIGWDAWHFLSSRRNILITLIRK